MVERSHGQVVLAVPVFLCMALCAAAQDKPGASAAEVAQGRPRLFVTVNGVREPVYRAGDAVKPPLVVSNPPPEYSEEARRDHVEGVVKLGMVVTSEGNVTLIHVLRSLGHGLDEKAIEAVRQWKFKPATKDGSPVSVVIAIETSFHLYQRP
jgi:TonB family protein